MKCNKCHEEMKLKEIEVGKDSAGNPIYNLYAFCYHCKTKVNIDKLKKAAKERKEAEQLADAKREASDFFFGEDAFSDFGADFFFGRSEEVDEDAREIALWEGIS